MAQETLQKTVLFIDDDGDFRDPIATALRSEGYRVRCASDGEEGVRMAAEETPDLVLLDIMMPGKNGFEATQDIRRIPAMRTVPIVVLTAFGQDIGKIHNRSQGGESALIQACVEKPVELNVLLERMAAALSAR